MSLSGIKKVFLKFLSENESHFSGTFVKKIAIFSTSFGFLGFLTALYLTIEHYLGLPVTCIVLSGCDKVLSSSYSEVFGIPVALFGVIYYFFVFSTSLFFLFGHPKEFIGAALVATPIGFLASTWFVILQLFIIKSICFYCMISAFLSVSLFIAACSVLFRIKRRKRKSLQ